MSQGITHMKDAGGLHEGHLDRLGLHRFLLRRYELSFDCQRSLHLSSSRSK